MRQSYVVGDYIIDYANIYQITSISQKDGEVKDQMVNYRPVKGTDKISTASIPEKNLGKSGLRKLLSNDEIEQLMEDLKKPLANYTYNPQLIKEEVYSNIPGPIICSLKYMWKNGTGIPKPIQELKDGIISHLCMEINFVTNEPQQTIKQRVEENLAQ